MQLAEEKITKPVSLKILIWLVPLVGVFISMIFWFGDNSVGLSEGYRHLIYGAIVTSGIWGGCMVIVSFLWNKYPWEHFPLKHLLIEVVLITIYTLFFSYGLYYISSQIGFIPCIEGNMVDEVITTLLITYFITTLHESVFFYRQWKYNFSKSVQLENKHLMARFESLKTQMNPHYVFNSLNNLVSIVDDNPLAVEYINQMSSFLRYMLKSREEELVSLDEELHMLEKYIYLHKIRFGDIFTVHMDISDQFKKYKLPPLTLQMLLENCIKHNVIAKNKPLTIHIKTHADYITIENNKNPKNHNDSTGQGLVNIQERYKYFTQQEIKVVDTGDYFKITTPLIP